MSYLSDGLSKQPIKRRLGTYITAVLLFSFSSALVAACIAVWSLSNTPSAGHLNQSSSGLVQWAQFMSHGTRLYDERRLLMALYGVSRGPNNQSGAPSANIGANASGQALLTASILNNRLEHLFNHHDEQINTFVLSSDGNFILTGSLQGSVKYWKRDTADVILEFNAESITNILDAAISFDDSRALISFNRTAIVWCLETGDILATLEGHSDLVAGVAFNPSGDKAITGSFDNTAIIWDLATSKQLLTFKDHSDNITSVAFSPDGSKALTGSWDKTAKLWNVNTGDVSQIFEGHDGYIHAVAFNPDGSEVVTSSSDWSAKVWDIPSGETVATLRGHQDHVLDVAFSPDGSKVITGSRDHTARIWQRPFETIWRRPLQETSEVLYGHEGVVAAVAFISDGQKVVTGAFDRTLRLWSLPDDEATSTLRGHADTGDWQYFYSGDVLDVDFSPNGKYVLTASGDRTAKIWSAASGQVVTVLEGHGKKVVSGRFSPDGAYVLTGSEDKQARLWSVDTGETVMVLDDHGSALTSIAFSPDGNYALTGSWGAQAILWDLKTGERLVSFDERLYNPNQQGTLDGWVTSLAFSQDGDRVLVGADDAVRLWDVKTREVLMTFQRQEVLAKSVAFHPIDNRILVGYSDNMAVSWNTLTGEQVAMFSEHKGAVAAVAFSADGSLIATASAETVILWDYETVTPLKSWRGHHDDITSVAFSSNGLQIVTGSADNTAKLWDIPQVIYASPEDRVWAACQTLRQVNAPLAFQRTDFQDDQFFTREFQNTGSQEVLWSPCKG